MADVLIAWGDQNTHWGKTMWRIQGEDAVYNPGREASEETTLTLCFPATRTVRNFSCLSHPVWGSCYGSRSTLINKLCFSMNPLASAVVGMPVPSKFLCCKPNAHNDGVRRSGVKEVIRWWEQSSLEWDQCPYKKGPRKLALPPHGDTVKSTTWKRAVIHPNNAGTLISDLQPREL